MTSRVKFPIRAKLLAMMSLAILAAIAAYLLLAIKIFKEDKTSLIYELNKSTVRTLSAEVEASLLKVADKVKLLTQGHRDAEWTKAVLEAEPDLVSYALYKPSSEPDQWQVVASVRNPEYLKLYNLDVSAVEQIREQFPIPFAKVLAKRSWVGNSTLASGAPIITLAIVTEIQGSGEHVAVADIRLDGILKLLSNEGILTAYVVDSEGAVIAHPDSALVTSRASMLNVPIVQDAIISKVAFQLKPFEWDGKKWLGAHSTVGVGGMSVISQVEESHAFRAARELLQKSLLFGLIVVTAGLLVSSWIAREFTQPIRKLLDATERLSRWEFGESISVRTNDEIAHLARAFNAMASDLQAQRAQLDANQAELERKVKERTSALEAQKSQLAEAQDALIRTTRLASLGELAGVAAHEVLNPVNNMNIRVERLSKTMRDGDKNDAQLLEEISGSWKKAFSEGGWDKLQAELLKAAHDGKKTLLEEDLENLLAISQDFNRRSSERVQDMEFLATEIMRITRIINNMRQLSRVGGERKPLDVHLPIDNTAITLSDIFEKRKVALIKDFGPEARAAYTVIGDKDELVQVFSNLVRNGLHAIDEAGRRAGEIRITTKRAGDRVEVRISDNGTGIKAEHLARVFEPNFTTKSIEEGTGLGLSISRRLVRAFGGDIEIESSAEGQGTTFLIWFPASS